MFLILLILLSTISTFYYFYSRRNLYKHAAKIPGIKSYPIIGSAQVLVFNHEDTRQNFQKLFEEYGRTFKFWIFWILLFTTAEPKHLQIILNSKNCLDKDPRYNLNEDAIGNGLFTSSGKMWKHQRKILNPVFGKKIVDSFVEIFVKHSQVLVEQLEKEAGKSEPFDANDYLSRCSMDFICDTAMGVSVDAQKKESKILKIMHRMEEILVERAVKVWLHLDIIWKYSTLGREFAKNSAPLKAFTNDIISKRYEETQNNEAQMENDDKYKPFLTHLLTLPEKLTLKELDSEVLMFIGTGSSTVSTAVQYVLVVLGMHQEVQEKLRTELLDVFGTTQRALNVGDLPKLKYLDRVIKETLRLYPPVPFTARSVSKDIDLGDYVIPEGSTILIPIAVTHLNPEQWKDPLKFDPDRFLPEEVAKRHPYSFIPFLAGPRNCIGLTYAMTACKVILATVLRSYRIGTKITSESIQFKTAVTSTIVGGFMITIDKL